MQVNNVNTSVQSKLSRKQLGNNNQNTSFKGVGMALDKFALGTANLIENGGLAISFTLQDMLGTNLPRPIMGLKRNQKENKGEANKSFAAKELVREMLTGPSMFIIPMGMLAGGKKMLGATVNVPMEFIKDFGAIHANNPLTATGETIGKQDFYKNAFTEIIKNAKAEATASDETVKKAANFAERLFATAKDKAAHKQTLAELSDEFIDIAKQYADDAIHTDYTKAAISKTTKAPFKETVAHMMSYADDIVEKVKTQDVSKIKEIIKKASDKNILRRLGMNVAMYGTILTFLQVIPRLYNKAEGKDNAGLKGLMKEETLKDENLNKQVQDKSNPSFGSATAVSKAVNTVTGNGFIGKLAKIFEFEGCNVSFPLLLGIMGFGVLLPRTRQAKDKYDREEILRRDLVTCAVMCFAEKELRKGFSKLNEINSGLVLAAKDPNFKNKSLPQRLFDYLRPIKGVQVLSSEQIVSKYSGIDKYKNGILGFCDFVEGQGGNLSKVFGVTEKSTELMGKILGGDIKNANNSSIKEALSKAIDSDDVKELVKLFEKKDNAWVQKAKTLNARFTALSVLVLVPVFLGFMLPAINERATKKRIKEEQAELLAKKQNSIKMLNTSFFNQKQNNIFTDIQNFTK